MVFAIAVVTVLGALAFLAWLSTFVEPRETEEQSDEEIRGVAGALQRMFDKIGEERL